MFRDRADAGERMAARILGSIRGPTVVLGVPRGGVIVAAPVARALDCALDIVVPRKLGAPGNAELAVGAVASGVTVVDEDLVRRLAIDATYLQSEVTKQSDEVDRRTSAYRAGRPPVSLADSTAVVVDDGVATGSTAIAAIRCAYRSGADRVVFAAPVAPAATIDKLTREADEVVTLEAPRSFFAVGEWYERFDQVSDDEVRTTLSAFSS